MTKSLITHAQSFMTDLAANNTKEWWEEHKPTYETRLKQPALALLERLVAPLSEMTGAVVKPKLFRPHRDVRFSKDKTPYHTHVHMLWAPQAERGEAAVYFFGIDPSRVTVGGGIMGFDKALLDDWRKMVDLDGPRIAGIVSGARSKGFDHWHAPELKRVPKPWEADHPQADLLRRKGLVMTRTLTPQGALEDDIMAAFADLHPVCDMLTSISDG